ELRSAGRARRPAPTCSDHIQTLFGIVQGGMDPVLRKESAERTIEIGFPGYAIGGLSVGEPRKLTREIVEATIQHLPAETPRYLVLDTLLIVRNYCLGFGPCLPTWLLPLHYGGGSLIFWHWG